MYDPNNPHARKFDTIKDRATHNLPGFDSQPQESSSSSAPGQATAPSSGGLGVTNAFGSEPKPKHSGPVYAPHDQRTNNKPVQGADPTQAFGNTSSQPSGTTSTGLKPLSAFDQDKDGDLTPPQGDYLLNQLLWQIHSNTFKRCHPLHQPRLKTEGARLQARREGHTSSKTSNLQGHPP